jgi:CubicO group peptidase (beta-lactamase class C family)
VSCTASWTASSQPASELDACFGVIERAIARGPIPGVAAGVGDLNSERLRCVGVTTPGGEAVSAETWYDLASLTKVLCTVPLCLDAIAAGRLDPRAPLRDVLPEVAWLQPQPNLGDSTIFQLATHTSGLPAWRPFYTLGLDRATLLANLLHTSLEQPPGRLVYSDLGFVLLGYLLERSTGQPLDVLAQALFARLGLDDALGFTPTVTAGVAPTEYCPWRSRVLRGEVHDENAAALGGVAGHAGLFGTLRGVCGYARALLDGRLHSDAVRAYLSHEHARAASPDPERRGFGWVLMSPGWSGGDLMSLRSIGHTGFTGTGVWVDLERGRFSVLLSNRVHPSRHVDSRIHGLRRAFNHAAHAE